MLNEEAEQGLLEIFGERVAFHETERTLYSFMTIRSNSKNCYDFYIFNYPNELKVLKPIFLTGSCPKNKLNQL